MRYHWGLGVGHFHAHCPASTSGHTSEEQYAQIPEHETQERLGECGVDTQIQEGNDDIDNPDDPELGLDDREYQGWDGEDSGREGGDEPLAGAEEEDFRGI
jgi:hypothetical protein